ncbi:MAG TPA: phage major capsid protein [Opitutus sp.]|nr:phage major capsid protein [Opitutus sp.]
MKNEDIPSVARSLSPRANARGGSPRRPRTPRRGVPAGAARLLAAAFLLGSFCAPAARADEASEAKLREALRNVTLQLRTAESDRAAQQNANAALTDDNKALTAKLEAVKKDFADERTATDKTIADLKKQLAARESDLAQAKETGEKWEASQKEAAALATGKEAERAKLEQKNLELARLLADREAKNLALFQTANEILTRYEKFSLGEALAAREPFVGRTRTKLENLVQDYEDKLNDQRVKQ